MFFSGIETCLDIPSAYMIVSLKSTDVSIVEMLNDRSRTRMRGATNVTSMKFTESSQKVNDLERIYQRKKASL